MTGVTNLNAELKAKRLRLATRPNWTGSPPMLKTIGMLAAASLATRAPIVLNARTSAASDALRTIDQYGQSVYRLAAAQARIATGFEQAFDGSD